MNKELKMDNIVIRTDDIQKYYGTGISALQVLKGISLDILKGEIVSIMGPSGAGKSTLLNIIGCLDHFQKGDLFILGKSVSGLSQTELSNFRNQHIGFIFQQHNLLPEFNAIENLMMPLLIRRTNKYDARKKSFKLLDRFGLSERIYHKPAELSGGECQRIAVARAIIGNPDMILADEPTGSLDSANSGLLTEILLDIARENSTTIVIVTHDMEISGKTERIISLRDGQIEQPVTSN